MPYWTKFQVNGYVEYFFIDKHIYGIYMYNSSALDFTSPQVT